MEHHDSSSEEELPKNVDRRKLFASTRDRSFNASKVVSTADFSTKLRIARSNRNGFSQTLSNIAGEAPPAQLDQADLGFGNTFSMLPMKTLEAIGRQKTIDGLDEADAGPFVQYKRLSAGTGALLEVRNLTVYGSRAGFLTKVVDKLLSVVGRTSKVEADKKVLVNDVSFTVVPGQLVGILGPSGSGKVRSFGRSSQAGCTSDVQ